MIKHLSIILLVIIIELSWNGCIDNNKKAIFVLIDKSISTDDPELKSRYFTDFQKIIEKVYGDDKIAVDFITSNSEAGSSIPLNIIIPKYDILTTNKMIYDSVLDYTKKEFSKEVKSLIYKSEYNRTDIFGSLRVADKFFNSPVNESYAKKILIIFSDMIVDDGKYNFEKEILDGTNIKRIIQSEQKAGNLPDLKGIKIWVIGATAEIKSRSLAINRIRLIEKFWKNYFAECGGIITNDRYTSKLIEFY
jgi:hypothetical protein